MTPNHRPKPPPKNATGDICVVCCCGLKCQREIAFKQNKNIQCKFRSDSLQCHQIRVRPTGGITSSHSSVFVFVARGCTFFLFSVCVCCMFVDGTCKDVTHMSHRIALACKVIARRPSPPLETGLPADRRQRSSNTHTHTRTAAYKHTYGLFWLCCVLSHWLRTRASRVRSMQMNANCRTNRRLLLVRVRLATKLRDRVDRTYWRCRPDQTCALSFCAFILFTPRIEPWANFSGARFNGANTI